ncbi:hypothetical protein ABT124_01750 [Streptomyces sp. NPDC001982]
MTTSAAGQPLIPRPPGHGCYWTCIEQFGERVHAVAAGTGERQG